MPEINVGQVIDYFVKPVVAGVKLDGLLSVGNSVHIIGSTTNLLFLVESIQIDNINVTEAVKGDLIGLKVPDRVRRGDKVYLVTE